MRIKASISFRQTGHIRSEWPHETQVAKCPHGRHARRLSSVKQSIHKFDDAKSVVELAFVSVFEWLSIVAIVDFDSIMLLVFDEFDENGSFDIGVNDDEPIYLWTSNNMIIQITDNILNCSVSRIIFILTLGTIMFSWRPLIWSICFWRIIQAINKSQSVAKSFSKNKKKNRRM